MIKVLGVQRVAILAVLFAINLLLLAGLYMHLQPETVKKKRELSGLRGAVSTLSNDITSLQIEFDQLEEQRAEFDDLKQAGFFDTQGRRQAEITLARAQDESGVIKAIASIASGTLEENAAAAKSDHKILQSLITIKVEALSDLDVVRYINLLEKYLPGHITVESLELERDAEISKTVLQSIASGGNPALVNANIKMMWKTMIPDQETEARDG